MSQTEKLIQKMNSLLLSGARKPSTSSQSSTQESALTKLKKSNRKDKVVEKTKAAAASGADAGQLKDALEEFVAYGHLFLR